MTTSVTNSEIFEVQAERAVAGGRILARHDGKIVLVAGALPGERLRVRVTRSEERWSEADVVEIVEPSPRRREPPCRDTVACGGFDWQHAERDLQLEMKRQIVTDAFRRIGGLDVAELLEGPDAVGDEFGVRQRITLTYDPAGRPGLLARGTHDVVPIDSCLAVRPEFNETILPWLKLTPPWKRAHVRIDSYGNSAVLFETGNPPSEKDRRRFGKITKDMERPESIVGLLADRIPLTGQRTLQYRVRDVDLRADATSFFQGSASGTERLVDLVEEMLGDDTDGELLDLYAGVGLFGVILGRRFARVLAVESDGRAAKHLKHNLKKYGVRGEARGERALMTLRNSPKSGRETVIIDPPRTGLDRESRKALLARRPERIVSVSCDPATAARDTQAAVAAGYRLERLVAVDLFPLTSHVETVGLLRLDDAAS